ncbi:unnamed protein product (macronuclear) [Paramecium tetraurelia]|uniref:Uncharacterized protein n=1 Tax=Paramecium tetraurelia TaxID=5888 RepID=A0CBT0_PARTE|nr:uncharacterized protein GSPATT00037030001 [Paramecium tetraurelia]CAK68247.1 unnamed protein product [Paramecium tetraurelia]|eukprot:XP_001435644.1 hypothetical protein (macronuclear) [Paramecium tetraurelia strain d4-2]
MNNFHKFDRSLLTVDISGAQPKQKSSYLDKIIPYDIRQANNTKLQYTIPKQDPQYGRRRYQHDFHHFNNSCVPQGDNYFDGSHKKHYNLQEGEIKQYRALENYYDQPKYYHIISGNLQGDRLLATNDIEGAIPATSTSKVVKNQEKAQKIRQERDHLRAQNNKALYLSQLESKIDYQPEVEQKAQRIKSYSIQPTHENQIFENRVTEPSQPKYEYMNKPLKLPPILARETPVNVNPISNKLQLHSNQKNYLLHDYDKTLSMLQQNLPTRLFV